MTLDASIILGGQPLNVLGAMDAGRQMAESQIALNRQNALAELYRTQGAGIAAGDQNALNALAAMDPMASLGVQDARLGMDQTRLGMEATRQEMEFSAEKMAMLRDQTKRETEAALAAQAANLTAEQLAAEQQALSEAMTGGAFFYQKKDKAGYDAFLRSKGLDPAEFPFEAFPAHAASVEGVLEAMKAFAPPTMDPNDRYKVAGGTIFDLAAEGGPKPVGQGAMQETVIMGPDGKPIMVQGGPGTSAKFTEAQSKDNVYATRARGALTKLETPIDPNTPGAGTYADTLTSRAGKIGDALNTITLGYSREAMQTPEFQTATTAGKEFVYAILRKDTGAAITAPEELMYFDVYLPQPGDLPERKAYKAEARARAVAAIEAGMNQQQLNSVTSALNAGDVETADRLIQEARGQSGNAPAAGGQPAPQELSDDDLLRLYGGE
jgi:hypothetical protein